MKGFSGFPAGRTRLVRIPVPFFSELLPLIDDLAELKVTLYMFALMERKEGDVRYATLEELRGDRSLMEGLGKSENEQQRMLGQALENAVARGSLLHVIVENERSREDWYLLNTQRGRETVDRISRGELGELGATLDEDTRLLVERPNIFVLYEQNIGLLQPLIAEELREAEQTFPASWITEAFALAVQNNVRKWKYVRSILDRWAAEGKNDGTDQGSHQKDGRRYLSGKYREYLEH